MLEEKVTSLSVRLMDSIDLGRLSTTLNSQISISQNEAAYTYLILYNLKDNESK